METPQRIASVALGEQVWLNVLGWCDVIERGALGQVVVRDSCGRYWLVGARTPCSLFMEDDNESACNRG